LSRIKAGLTLILLLLAENLAGLLLAAGHAASPHTSDPVRQEDLEEFRI
jgi:hypothetical protein